MAGSPQISQEPHLPGCKRWPPFFWVRTSSGKKRNHLATCEAWHTSLIFFRNGRIKRAENVKRGRGRPNLTWDESVKRDLKDWNIIKEQAMDRGAWKLAIHVSEPWLGFEILWVSTLAYPNLFGTERLCYCCCCICARFVFLISQCSFWFGFENFGDCIHIYFQYSHLLLEFF